MNMNVAGSDSGNLSSDQDLSYMSSLSAAVVQRSPRYLINTVLVIFLFFIFTFIWMAWANIDVVVRGSGKVIPARHIQQVQSLEGGVVADILVREGDLVDANQALLKLSDVAFASSYQEGRLKYDELVARSVRLRAEAHDEKFNTSDEFDEELAELLRSELSLFESNADQLTETLSIYKQQITQQENSLKEAQSRVNQLSRELKLVRDEIKIKKPLMEEKIISEIDFIQLQRKEAELEGELEIAKIAMPRLQASIEEARGKLSQSELDFRNKAKKELNEVLAEISRIAQTQQALEDRVSRTTLRSPVKGVVKRLHANSIGGVVSPGAPVIEIVPLGDSLLVEVQIKPADIATIRVDQMTRLKFSAYDFAIHGSLSGKVSFVSADTITDDEGNSYYVVRVQPDQAYIGKEDQNLPIKVGMTSEADIITDKKSILAYLLKPINRGLEKALTES
jgi:adhesin transport system membrane fusion protein